MRRVALLSAFLFAAPPVLAQGVAGDPAEALDNPPDHSEVKFGVLAHDVPIFTHPKEGGFDFNGEILLRTMVPESMLDGVPQQFHWLLEPRLHIGASINDAGGSSQVYVGVTDTAVLARNVFTDGDEIFASIGLGPSFNNGHISTTDPHRKSVGGNVLIHPIADFGVQIDPRFSVSLTVDHASNGGLARYNAGLNDVGVRLGIRF